MFFRDLDRLIQRMRHRHDTGSAFAHVLVALNDGFMGQQAGFLRVKRLEKLAARLHVLLIVIDRQNLRELVEIDLQFAQHGHFARSTAFHVLIRLLVVVLLVFVRQLGHREHNTLMHELVELLVTLVVGVNAVPELVGVVVGQ